MAAIKSNGSSSSYYDIPVSQTIMESIVTRYIEGECFIRTQEIIEMLGSDFDVGNCIKASVRAAKVMQGCGKEGNDIPYEGRKIAYSGNRLVQRFSDEA